MAVPTHLIRGSSDAFVGPDLTLYRFLTPLQAFDGSRRYARSISKLPRPGWSDDFSEDEVNTGRFLQAAGSANAMTVEVSTGEKGGGLDLYTVGRADNDKSTSPPTVPIHFGDNVVMVYPNEVFKAQEAADIFYFYYLNDSVPEEYSLRKFGVDKLPI